MKNEDLKSVCHFPLDGKSSGMIFNNHKKLESAGFQIKSRMTTCPEQRGRTLLETLATLSVVILLGIGAIKSYHYIVGRTKAQNTAKMIMTLAMERQNMGSNGAGVRPKVKGPHSDLYVKNGTPGNHSKYFWVETTLADESFCQALKTSSLIRADLIEVNDVIDGNCTDHSKLAFYFKKDTFSDDNLTWVDGEGKVQKCPAGSSACDSSGNATACETGYYLSLGECERCGAHVARCEDENTPTSCMSGYELHWNECILPPQVCTTDSDCDVCATCDTETGRCQGECKIPKNECDDNDDCGKNDCMICDTSRHMCTNGCTKVDYLESTGTQYIDTGYKLIHDDLEIKTKVRKQNIPSAEEDIAGFYRQGTPGFVLGFHQKAVFLFTGGTSGNDVNCYSNTISDGQFVEISAKADYTTKKKYLTVNGSTIEKVNNYPVASTNDKNFLLFKGNSYYLLGQMYYFQIYDNSDLIRDFIPVLAPDGEPCMFDRVTQKLFRNASTGTFDYGPK